MINKKTIAELLGMEMPKPKYVKKIKVEKVKQKLSKEIKILTPEQKAMKNKANAEWARKKRATDPEFRKRATEAKRKYMAKVMADPIRRKKYNETQRKNMKKYNEKKLLQTA